MMSQSDIEQQLKLIEQQKRDIIRNSPNKVNRLIELELVERLLLKDLLTLKQLKVG